MKVNTLTIGLFFFSVISYACSCSYGTLSAKLNSFDNIYTAKVVKVLEYHSNSKQAKKIEVEFLEKINFKILYLMLKSYLIDKTKDFYIYVEKFVKL